MQLSELKKRRVLQGLEGWDSDIRASGGETETSGVYDPVRPKKANVHAAAASGEPLRRHSSDGSNRRRLQLPEYEGETLFSTAEESKKRCKTPAPRPVHTHGHGTADKMGLSTRPTISKRESSSSSSGGKTIGAHSGVLGFKHSGTGYGLADFLFGTPKRGQAKRAAGGWARAAVGGPGAG